MIRNILIYPIFTFSVLISQNFNYQEGDWFILQQPGAINTIAETPYLILIGTENGIYTQDKYTEEIIYDHGSSSDLPSKNIRFLLYDSNTDHYWAVHREGISFKSSISRYWRDLLYFTVNLTHYTDIDEIGFTNEAIWIKSGYDYLALDPFNGSLIKPEIYPEEHQISWASSRYGAGGNIDLYNYSFPMGWSVNYDIITDKNNSKITPTVLYENKFGSTWIGTEFGIMFYGKTSSLNPYFLGLPQSHITEIFLDNHQNWWFADSRYRRSELFSSLPSRFLEDGIPFLTRWDEVENNWYYYYSNESVSISNTDINCIERVEDTVYFGTMNGLLILNLIDRSWDHLYRGLSDKAIWDLAVFDNSVYVATAKGINEISTIQPSIIPDTENWFKDVQGEEIYQLEVLDSNLYIASESGFQTVNLTSGRWDLLSEKYIRKFHLNDGATLAWDGQIWKILIDKEDRRVYPRGYDFTFSGDFVWVLEKKQAVLYNSQTDEKWIYNRNDGIPGKNIYTIDCDENWVWFGTDAGAAYFRWSNYH